MPAIFAERLAAIQSALREEGLDGWLLYDAHGLNPIARQIVGVEGVVTRRWFALVPAQGTPRFLFHRIENLAFEPLAGEKKVYRTWQELDAGIDWVLGGCQRVAMEYSPDNAIPYVARVDAATIEKIRARSVEIATSADLVARFLATWSPAQVESHNRAARALIEIKDLTFAMIAKRVRDKATLTEHDVAEFMRAEFARRGMVHHHEGPICAVGANAGNPHYEPFAEKSAAIGPEQLVLLDLWAKFDEPDAVYADITWTCFTGKTVPAEIGKVFGIVMAGRDRAISFANEAFGRGATVHGYEVDRAVRQVIADAGYGEQFIHRTGHSLGRTVHDVGPNIDDLETQDRRRLQEGMAFTVEPGIYLPHFGIRSEINVFIQNQRAVVTTLPLQTEVVCLVVAAPKRKTSVRMTPERKRTLLKRFRSVPYPNWLGLKVAKLSSGTADLSLPISKNHLQYQGITHGGALASLADTAATFAALTAIPENTDVVTIEFKVNFLSGMPQGTAIARGTVVRVGSRVAVSEVRVFESKTQRLVMTGTFTMLVFPKQDTKA